MKKIMVYTIAMVFVLALGSAYAGNGITEFNGRYDENAALALTPAPVASVEGSSTGGIRAEDPVELHNGVTDFSGRYDENSVLALTPAPVASVEGSSTGGMRAVDSKELLNGITDFSGHIDSN